MCGIFSLLNNNFLNNKMVSQSFNKGKNRGPENSILKKINILCEFGFHRLAINGLNDISNQPITINDVTLICNGEIYNYKELYQFINVEKTTDSDCEIIIHLYLLYGIDYTLQLLDGVFSFILCDARITENFDDTKLYVCRDPYGVRPLYHLKPVEIRDIHDGSMNIQEGSIQGFASEVKMLIDIHKELVSTHEIVHFQPGTYSLFLLPFHVSPIWETHFSNKVYHTFGFTSCITSIHSPEKEIMFNIKKYLTAAVKKRVLNTDRPIACLLSGGLDSSLITSLVNSFCPNVETFSIGLEGSEDLKYAKIVANYLGTKHTEVVLTEHEFIEAIPEVIQTIESYDTTTVRASIGNYLLAKYISTHSDAKVIFNGDGSDEVCGGYIYMDYAPNELEFDRETKRLLTDIHKFDVLRSDKSISSNGLEPRTPFLDRTFVQFYQSIHPSIRHHKKTNQCEKYLLRKAFSDSQLLPEEVLWRKKEAFSDGVSKHTRSLFVIIQEYVEKIKLTPTTYTFNDPDTQEKKYYRHLYESFYPNTEQLVPYFWMPKWVKATDASARTLDNYINPR
jgi:asparagine synthase (glutamine-hydrolysing)